MKVVLICLTTLIFQSVSFALTPLQYCERLHTKRPAGATTSYELLNVDISPGVMVNTPRMSAPCGTSGNVSKINPPAPYENEVFYALGLNATFEVSSKITKYCKDGFFRYKSERIVKNISDVRQGVTCAGSDEYNSWPDSVSGGTFGIKTHVSDTNEPP